MSTTEKRIVTLKESDALRAMPALNPQALITKAIEQGAGIETLERLVALAKDVQAIAAREAFNEALTEFQKRCPPIAKSRKAEITLRSGGSYSYSYAPLDKICDAIEPLLTELGLSKRWITGKGEANRIAISCVISHRLGHSEESGAIEIPIVADGRMNPGQAVGSSMTYGKRYSLQNALGIAPEEDDDLQSGNRGEDDETTGLVADVFELWRDMKLSRGQVKTILAKHHLSDTLADPRVSWSGVDPAAIATLRDEMKAQKANMEKLAKSVNELEPTAP